MPPGESEDCMDWLDRADRFWACELRVGPAVFRTDGFHALERASEDVQARAIVVGTSSATVVSLPKGSSHALKTAGLNLEHMARSPRHYVASCSAMQSLEVRGPAYLAYWPSSVPLPSAVRRTERLCGDNLMSLTSLRDTAPAEWEEAGIGPDSRVFGCALGIDLSL
jgi:hypothetical protein